MSLLSSTPPFAPKPAAGPRDPLFALIYGPPDIGKTGDLTRLGDRWAYGAAPGALKQSRKLWGYDAQGTRLERISDATRFIVMQAQKPVGARPLGLGIDDFSFLADRTFSLLEAKHTGFRLWGALRSEVIDFRDAARYAGMHVVLSAWVTPPKNTNNRAVRGGPRLSGDLPEYFPALCDLVLRATFSADGWPWKAVYRCGLSAEYVQRDRDHGTPDPAPMNLGEIMRHNGYAVPYGSHITVPPQVVEDMAQAMLDTGPEQERQACEVLYQSMLASAPAPVAYQLVGDALARVQLRRADAARGATFGPQAPAAPVLGSLI